MLDTMKTETKNCYHCDAELVLGDNWTEARKAQAKYLCKKCWHSRDMYVDNRYISKKHPLFKPGKYKSFGDAAFSALQKDIQIKEGYVYAIRNKAWPEWVKIGKAIDAQDRLNGYQTSSPMRDYELIHAVYFDDRNQAERDAHIAAERKGERQGEWFKITEEQALDVLQEVTDK